MAVRFHLPNGRTTNLVMLSQLLFPARRPEDLLEAIALAEPDEPGGPLNRARPKPFLQEHPEVAAVLQMRAASSAPAGFDRSEYHAVHVFRFSSREGIVTNLRCHWIPEAGAHSLPIEELGKLSCEVLLDEFDAQLARATVGLELET